MIVQIIRNKWIEVRQCSFGMHNVEIEEMRLGFVIFRFVFFVLK